MAIQIPITEVHLEPKYGTAEKLVHKNSSTKTTGSRTRLEWERNLVCAEDVYRELGNKGKKSEIRRKAKIEQVRIKVTQEEDLILFLRTFSIFAFLLISLLIEM